MSILSVFNKIGINASQRLEKSTNITRSTSKYLLRFWLEAAIGIVVIAMLAVVYPISMDSHNADETKLELANARVTALVQRWSQALGFYHNILDILSNDQHTYEVLKQGDAKAIRVHEQEISNIIPGAIQVRLLPPNYDSVDFSSDPPISYAALDMLNSVKKVLKTEPLEIHLVNSKLYLVGATILKNSEGGIGGLILLTLDTNAIKKEIKSFDQKYGIIVLQQLVDKDTSNLLYNKDGINPDDALLASAKRYPISNSRLNIVFLYAEGTEIPLLVPIIIMLILLLIGCGILLFIQHRRLLSCITFDLNTALSIIERLLTRGKTVPQKFHLFEFHFFADQVIKLPDKLKVAAETIKPNAETTAVTISEEIVVPKVESSAKSTPTDGLLLDVAAVDGNTPKIESQDAPAIIAIPPIYRTFDIRGLAGETITEEFANKLGQAIGSELENKGQQKIYVARDIRPSSKEISNALINGLVASGRAVINLGMVPSPVFYFAAKTGESGAGVMITAGRSSNKYNGFKILNNGNLLTGESLVALHHRIEQGNLHSATGSTSDLNLVPDYKSKILESSQPLVRQLKVVIDCGSGSTGPIIPEIFEHIGCEVFTLLCTPDHNYPLHPPNPGHPENLKLLQKTVLSEQADLGIATNSNGNRLIVIDSRGRIIWPDRLLMVLAEDALSRNPGSDIIFDVNCARILAKKIADSSGRPIICRTGYAAIKEKMLETGAILGGDWSGHIMFKDWYEIDDACYAGIQLLVVLSDYSGSTSEFFDKYPESISTPEFSAKVPEGRAMSLINDIRAHIPESIDIVVKDIDGLRIEYSKGWGLVRPANTASALRFRFEADDEESLGHIQQTFRELLSVATPKVKIPF